MAQLLDPLPGGTLERTDQGVDISGRPGMPIVAVAKSKLIGIIPDWYQGQPFMWFKILSGPFKGKYWYTAEQIKPVTTRRGTIFQAGQAVAHYAASGTGTESGFATASGETLAMATTGYREGEATQAGDEFRRAIGAGASGTTASRGGGRGTRTRSIIVTASMYGPQGGDIGASGINLSQHPDSFAELSNNYNAPIPSLDFDALGGLPMGTPITVTNLANGKSITVFKRDVGAGGPGLRGHKRAVDLWYEAADKIGFKGLGLVKVTFNGGSSAGDANPGMSRPGGAPSSAQTTAPPSFSADYASLLSGSRTAPASASGSSQFTSLDLGPLNGLTNGMSSLFGPALWLFGRVKHSVGTIENDIQGGVKDANQFFDILGFILNPYTWLRAVEFITGMLLMGYGLNMMNKNANRVRGSSGLTTAAATVFGEGAIAREVRRSRQTREYESTRHTARISENTRRINRASTTSTAKPQRKVSSTTKKRPGPRKGSGRSAQNRASRSGTQRLARKVAKVVK